MYCKILLFLEFQKKAIQELTVLGPSWPKLFLKNQNIIKEIFLKIVWLDILLYICYLINIQVLISVANFFLISDLTLKFVEEIVIVIVV